MVRAFGVGLNVRIETARINTNLNINEKAPSRAFIGRCRPEEVQLRSAPVIRKNVCLINDDSGMASERKCARMTGIISVRLLRE